MFGVKCIQASGEDNKVTLACTLGSLCILLIAASYVAEAQVLDAKTSLEEEKRVFCNHDGCQMKRGSSSDIDEQIWKRFVARRQAARRLGLNDADKRVFCNYDGCKLARSRNQRLASSAAVDKRVFCNHDGCSLKRGNYIFDQSGLRLSPNSPGLLDDALDELESSSELEEEMKRI